MRCFFLHNNLTKLNKVKYNKVVKSKTEVKRIGVDVPDELWKKVRAQALLENKALAEWVAEAFKTKLSGNG